jgi:LysR family transcriptional regulator, nod-box dependent transcriptional activator
MRFKGFDLNHLIVLDQLLAERSVSRAAEKLGRTQSTVSGVLARLRMQFGDELLVQVGRDMVPTERGLALAAVARDLLLQVDATILTPPEFDPASTNRRIKVFASDYLMIAGLADAMRKLSSCAPNLTIEVMQPTQFLRPGVGPAALLENGEIDLLAMPQNFLSPKHAQLPLFTETCCCLVCRDNPDVGDSVSIKDFLELGHVAVSFGPDALPSYEEWFIREYGTNARRIEVSAGSFATMPFLLPGTRRIALAHRRLAEAYTRILPLRIVETNFTIPPLIEAIQWHRYNAADQALMWVRDQIVASMATA